MANSSRQSMTLHDGARHLHGSAYLREILKLHIRAILHPQVSQRWLCFLGSDPYYRELVRLCPRLIGKVFRPYLTNTLNSTQRCALLIAHYKFVRKLGWDAICLRAAAQAQPLARMIARDGSVYSLQLRCAEPMEREGECTLELFCDTQHVYSCSFVFLQTAGPMHLAVGCVQGPRAADGAERIRKATRDLHGLRPIGLMIKVLQALGAKTGCQQLHLVSNPHRAVRKSLRAGKVFAEYDAYWMQFGAFLNSDGDYRLACCSPSPPDFGEMPSKRRSAARARYQLIAHVIEECLSSLRIDIPYASPCHSVSQRQTRTRPEQAKGEVESCMN